MNKMLGAPVVMRFCATCSTVWVGHDSSSFGGVYRCPQHQAEYMAGFDPQPNSVVRFIDGPPLDYVVLAREGDWLTIRRLGLPDSCSSAVSIRELHPGMGACPI